MGGSVRRRRPPRCPCEGTRSLWGPREGKAPTMGLSVRRRLPPWCPREGPLPPLAAGWRPPHCPVRSRRPPPFPGSQPREGTPARLGKERSRRRRAPSIPPSLLPSGRRRPGSGSSGQTARASVCCWRDRFYAE